MPPTARRILVSLIVLLAALAVAACGQEPIARGYIVEVETGAVPIRDWNRLTIETPDGRRLTFLRGETVDLRFWRTSHLQGHQRTGERVIVYYRETPEGLVATSIEDG